MNKVKKNNYKKWDKLSNGNPENYLSKLYSRYTKIFVEHLECDLCSTRLEDLTKKKCPHCGRMFLYAKYSGVRRLNNAENKYYGRTFFERNPHIEAFGSKEAWDEFCDSID